MNDDPRSAVPEYVRQPVNLTPEVLMPARALLADGIEFGRKLVPAVDADAYKTLAEAVLDLLLSGACARHGLKISELTERCHAGRGGLPAKFGPQWQRFTAVVVRTVCLAVQRETLYEEIYSMPVAVRRGDNSIGTEKKKGSHNSLHLLIWAVASFDHHCPTVTRPLTTGTRDDRSRAGNDLQRIETHDAQLGGWLPGSISDNIRSLLASGYQLSEREKKVLGRVFSPYMLVGELPCGPPSRSHTQSETTVFPGRDPEIASVLSDAPRRAMLYAGHPRRAGDDDERALSLDNTFVRLPINQLRDCDRLNINQPFGVRYQWSQKRELLALHRRHSTDVWRLVNFKDEDELPVAAALIERHAQHDWPADCLERWALESAPGLVHARHPVTRQGLVDLLNAANAAAVAAERRSRAR